MGKTLSVGGQGAATYLLQTKISIVKLLSAFIEIL